MNSYDVNCVLKSETSTAVIPCPEEMCLQIDTTMLETKIIILYVSNNVKTNDKCIANITMSLSNVGIHLTIVSMYMIAS